MKKPNTIFPCFLVLVAFLSFESTSFAEESCVAGTSFIKKYADIGDSLPAYTCHTDKQCHAIPDLDDDDPDYMAGHCDSGWCYIPHTYTGSVCSGISGDEDKPGDDTEGGGGGEETSPGTGGSEGDAPPSNSGGDSGSGDGGNSDSGSNTPPPNERGGPVAPLCDADGDYDNKRDGSYWHMCYDNYGDYWFDNDYYSICDPEDSVSDWDECFFGNKYYESYGTSYGRSPNTWNNPYDYAMDKCEYEYREYGAVAEHYCRNRYGDSNEARLYDVAASDTSLGVNVTDGLPGNSTVDVGEKLGVGTSGVSDLLGHKAPKNNGAFGVCLADLEIEVFGNEISLPLSRVCPFLEHLGTIFLFLSLFSAVRIIYRG